ncbi:haloacid dehalogenase-like hydrolase [Bradyrhizobium jicamae]|uniref:haloacid dehalogenase-like hydrolase n=1 Tax=Bradyrhizobium jicamae TaxID=280332 RepID=UPI001BAD1C8B|nr:haloacid dehalogenase-like hydrolase [Bradyrhizobium jicamae]MBR0752509.1 haloacid dehalogenase-like hydrolase [Bradyrhizobium jicamae]
MTDLFTEADGIDDDYGVPHRGRAGTVFSLPSTIPLVLDLDGTLIRGDLLYKSFFSILRRNPLIVVACAAWLLRGRAALKRQLALRNRINWDNIELHHDVVALANHEKAAGRRVVLATAADAVLAGQLAAMIPCIDHVFASDGEHNLKGANKAALLRRTFPQGFIYAGDSRADLAVWREAAGIVTVAASDTVRSAARALGKPAIHLQGRVD